MSRQVLGIDLGTTNSVVASIDDRGTVVILRNALGSEITPSAVYFDPDGGVVVGEEALQAAAVDPDNAVRLIKRQMGTEFPLVLGGQEHTPESISALILRQLAAAAPGGLAAAPRAVITVPAYFGLAEREATYQAGIIAGLDVLELLDEPVAAAAHYGLTSGGDRTVLVYDLGGGTFDTTVLRIGGRIGHRAGHRWPPFARRRRRRSAPARRGAGAAGAQHPRRPVRGACRRQRLAWQPRAGRRGRQAGPERPDVPRHRRRAPPPGDSRSPSAGPTWKRPAPTCSTRPLRSSSGCSCRRGRSARPRSTT